jgi:hypothetical protein
MHAEKKRFQLKPVHKELKRTLIWGSVDFYRVEFIVTDCD